MDERLGRLRALADLKFSIAPEQVRELISLMTDFARSHLAKGGFSEKFIKALTTKFRDAGRRSPPWKPASSKVPGRPQDGADGNRRLRWLFDRSHKFHADEVTATLVEVRYYLQMLSMRNAPPLEAGSIQQSFTWLTGHSIEPGQYEDPIQLLPIDLGEFEKDPRSVVSGHLVPLDRGGRHEPANAFLILHRSNQLQGNLKLQELLILMEDILARHQEKDIGEASREMQ